MARQKAADELFCRSCGIAIKKSADICPHCGVATDSFPGFESNQPTSGGSFADRATSDMKVGNSFGKATPYIAWAGGVILILAGLGALLSPPSLITGILGALVMIASGAFALPPVRDELRPELAEAGVSVPLDPGIVAFISIAGYIFGSVIASL